MAAKEWPATVRCYSGWWSGDVTWEAFFRSEWGRSCFVVVGAQAGDVVAFFD